MTFFVLPFSLTLLPFAVPSLFPLLVARVLPPAYPPPSHRLEPKILSGGNGLEGGRWINGEEKERKMLGMFFGDAPEEGGREKRKESEKRSQRTVLGM